MRVVVSVVSVGVLTSPLHAQAPEYFKSLSVPPQAVGTCVQSARATARASGLEQSSRLVITSGTPSARRELSLSRDSTGAVIGFSEIVSVSDGALARTGETVVASLRPDGRVVGHVMRSTLALPENRERVFDSTAMQRMRDNAKASLKQTELDTLEQQRVRVLAGWLATRCPG